MSTKTTFKRVAAVAAAALAISGFTAVSSHATGSADYPFAITAADSIVVSGEVASAGSANAVAGVNNYVEFTVGSAITAVPVKTTYTVTASGAGSNILATASNWTLNNANAAAGTLATATTSPYSASATTDIHGNVIKVNTPTAGTVTVVVSKNVLNTTTGTTTVTTQQTFTITVGAASVVGTLSVANSSSIITDSSTVNGYSQVADFRTAAAAVTTDATVIASKGTVGSSSQVATVLVTLKDTQSPTAGLLKSKKLDATISGSGLIMGTDAADADLGHSVAKARVASSYTDSTNGVAYFGVYNDGTAGTGTITITYTDALNVTTTISTETVTFYGGVATLTPTIKYANVANTGSAWPSSTPATAAATGAIANYAVKLKLTDSAGNLVKSNPAITVKSSDTTKVASSSCSYPTTLTGYAYCSVTAVAAASGKATLTFSVGAASTFDLVTTTTDVTVVGSKAASVVVSADSSVSSGQVITYTVTAHDAAGNSIADGALVTDYLAASPTVAGGALVDNGGNANAVASLFTGVRFLNGTATDTVQAPFGSTSIVATFDGVGAGVATVGGTYYTTAAAANFETVLTTAVTGDAAAQAAIDAAQEATDAANAAYDAANNAMDSADAATAAAQDASDNAAAALAAVTSLSATVAKLVKSVAAIAAALAKVQKKIGA